MGPTVNCLKQNYFHFVSNGLPGIIRVVHDWICCPPYLENVKLFSDRRSFFIIMCKFWMEISIFFNLLAPGRFEYNFRWSIFNIIFGIDGLRHLSQNCTEMNGIGCYWWWINIWLGNGVVPSGNKSLPEPMLTQIYASYGITRPQWVKTHIN